MDDDLLNGMGDAALGAVTAHIYSAAHPSQMNKDFVAAYKKAFGSRPGFMAVSGYDGMHLIYEALKKTNGNADGDALIAAAKGMSWESPRGPIMIDPETRDVVETVYIRRVEKVGNELVNVEFDKVENVKDPVKERMKK
jgi:branched-chain amino acid transport system substrate-binding protein